MLMNDSDVEGATAQRGDLWEFILDEIYAVIVVYLTLCQIAVFIHKLRKRQTCTRIRNCYDILKPSNLRLLMNLAVVLSGIFGVLHFTLLHVNYYIPYYPATYAATTVATTLSVTCMYLVLWFRQISFYSNPTIKHLSNLTAKYFSYIEGVLIILAGFTFAVLYAQQIYHRGCSMASCLPNWLFLSVTVTQFQIQIALLLLFIWPLLKHRRNMKNTAATTKQKSIMNLIKRATIVAAISILIDVTTIVTYLFTASGPVFDSVLALNFLCLLFCFADYKERILPCFLNAEASDEDIDSQNRAGIATSST